MANGGFFLGEPQLETSPAGDMDANYAYRVAASLIRRYGANAQAEVSARLENLFAAAGKAIAVEAAIVDLQYPQAPGPDDVIN